MVIISMALLLALAPLLGQVSTALAQETTATPTATATLTPTPTATATPTPTATPIPEPTATTCGSSPLQGRTQKVVDAIVATVSGVSSCANITATHLAALTRLELNNQAVTALQSGDFAGWLYLNRN